jgi:hypothetical protein
MQKIKIHGTLYTELRDSVATNVTNRVLTRHITTIHPTAVVINNVFPAIILLEILPKAFPSKRGAHTLTGASPYTYAIPYIEYLLPF